MVEKRKGCNSGGNSRANRTNQRKPDMIPNNLFFKKWREKHGITDEDLEEYRKEQKRGVKE
jgi:hypothetical protein